MASTSALPFDNGVEYYQYRRPSEADSVSSSDATYCPDEYCSPSSEPAGFATISRQGSFSSAPDVYIENASDESGMSTPVFHCTLCPWSTSSSSLSDYHLRAHEGDCLFACALDGCEATFSEADGLVAHTRRHEARLAASAMRNRSKRSWHETEGQADAQSTQTPQQPFKRSRYEPITPITPSTAFTTAPDPPSFKPSTISRALSYETTPRQPHSYHYNDPYSPSHASPSHADDYTTSLPLPRQGAQPDTLTTFILPASPSDTPVHRAPVASPSIYERPSTSYYEGPSRQLLASPLPLSASAPLDRGRFEPYPLHFGSTSMSVSQSLPQPPPHFQSPSRGRTIHSRRREQHHYGGRDGAVYPYDSRHLQSPVSPATRHGPCLAAFSPSHHDTSSRRSSTSSAHTPQQAALLSAASMNRLLARLPTPTSSSSVIPPQPPSPLAPDISSITAVHPRYREPAPVSRASALSAQANATASREHVCVAENCGKRFKRFEHLKRHERTHTMERPFKCEIPGCDKSFSRSDNLQQHRKTHDNPLGKTSRAMAAAAAARKAAAAAEVEGEVEQGLLVDSDESSL
ncbi:hypothetical protein JCM8547_006283 [Rhodosporidiobolus lusitaniae]